MKQGNIYLYLAALFVGILAGVMLGAQLRVISVYAPVAVWIAALLCAAWAGVKAWREDRQPEEANHGTQRGRSPQHFDAAGERAAD